MRRDHLSESLDRARLDLLLLKTAPDGIVLPHPTKYLCRVGASVLLWHWSGKEWH